MSQVRTVVINLLFDGTNTIIYNIQASNIAAIKSLTLKQLTVVNNSGTNPPVNTCSVYSDLISPDQALCSAYLIEDTNYSLNLENNFTPIAPNCSGNHVFTLLWDNSSNYDWSAIDVAISLTIQFNS